MTRKFVFSLIFVLAAVGLGIYLSRKPWIVLQEQRASANASKADMQKAERERSDLLQKKTHIDSPMGKEELVREAGYTKPGEVPLGAR